MKPRHPHHEPPNPDEHVVIYLPSTAHPAYAGSTPKPPRKADVTITVYSKPKCVQCNATKNYLNKRALPYTVIDITESIDDYRAVQALGFTQAPVVIAHVNGKDEMWSGFRPDRIDELFPKPAGGAA